MKATFEVRPGLSFEIESDDVKDVFQGVSEVHEVFGEPKCGACGAENIRFRHRNVDGNDFYEMYCLERGCGCSLSYGQEKSTGKIYPKRYEVDGKGKAVRGEDGKPVYLPNNGWRRYTPKS